MVSSNSFNRFFSNSTWTTVINLTTFFAASWQPLWSRQSPAASAKVETSGLFFKSSHLSSFSWWKLTGSLCSCKCDCNQSTMPLWWPQQSAVQVYAYTWLRLPHCCTDPSASDFLNHQNSLAILSVDFCSGPISLNEWVWGMRPRWDVTSVNKCHDSFEHNFHYAEGDEFVVGQVQHCAAGNCSLFAIIIALYFKMAVYKNTMNEIPILWQALRWAPTNSNRFHCRLAYLWPRRFYSSCSVAWQANFRSRCNTCKLRLIARCK